MTATAHNNNRNRQKHEARFNSLRIRYMTATKLADAHETALVARHGPEGYRWATAAEKRKHDKLRQRQSKIGDEIFELVQSLSPRNWESGVPAWWIYEKLPFKDVVRPKSESLSITPPLAWGASRHMT